MLIPRLAGLVALYGDIFVGEWYSKPHAADAVVGDARLRDIEQYSSEIEKFFDSRRRPVAGRPFKDGTEVYSMFYHHLVRKGEFLKRTFGIDHITELESRPDLYYLFSQYSAKDNYLLIILVHGTNDTTIPYDQSVFFSKYNTSKGLDNELHPLEGNDHFWDLGEENEVLEATAKI